MALEMVGRPVQSLNRLSLHKLFAREVLLAPSCLGCFLGGIWCLSLVFYLLHSFHRFVPVPPFSLPQIFSLPLAKFLIISISLRRNGGKQRGLYLPRGEEFGQKDGDVLPQRSAHQNLQEQISLGLNGAQLGLRCVSPCPRLSLSF